MVMAIACCAQAQQLLILHMFKRVVDTPELLLYFSCAHCFCSGASLRTATVGLVGIHCANAFAQWVPTVECVVQMHSSFDLSFQKA